MKTTLDLPISLNEISIAVNQLKKGKVPGLDGFPVEFYQVFWEEIKHSLHALFMAICQGTPFPQSCSIGIISLLEKPGKDKLLIENWRPLTLLCCDYKIFSKILSNRIEFVINDLIHSDQSGFIKGRSIAQNLLDLNSVIMYAEKENIPMVVCAFDFAQSLRYT